MTGPRRQPPDRRPADRSAPRSTPGLAPPRGRCPYGYQVVVMAGPHGTEQVMEPDDRTAPVVRRIFADYLAGSGLHRIAEDLTAEAIPCPSAHDRSRNPHHGGVAWSKGAVRGILVNPRYTGLYGWDGGDLGDRPLEPAYEPVIEAGLFRRVQEELAAKRHDPRAGGEPILRSYTFRGLLRCGICNRLMQGTWNNDEAYYRCRVAGEYAAANHIVHPRNVYVRELRLRPALDCWLTTTCTPAGLRPLLRADDERADTYAALRLRLVYSPRQQLVRVRIELGPDQTSVRGLLDLRPARIRPDDTPTSHAAPPIPMGVPTFRTSGAARRRHPRSSSDASVSAAAVPDSSSQCDPGQRVSRK